MCPPAGYADRALETISRSYVGLHELVERCDNAGVRLAAVHETLIKTLVGPGILVAQVAMEPFSASDPVELSDIRRRFLSNFDVTEDGQRFLVTVFAGRGDTEDTADTAPGARLNVILNWFEELKQRVPTGR